MNMSTERPIRVAIIGGGITGLSAAWYCQQQRPDSRIVLLESARRLGGVLKTTQHDGWLVEHSADMFATDPDDAVRLCRELGMKSELVSTSPVGRTAWVVRDGTLYPVPRGLALMIPHRLDSLLTTPILSPAGRYRAVAEPWMPPREDPTDESLKQFAIRRFGQEMFERLIQPLVGGIYSADPSRLSMRAALTRFVDAEQRHGSLTAAAWDQRFFGTERHPDPETGRRPAQRTSAQSVTVAESSRHVASGEPMESESSGARYGMFVAPVGGMQRLVDRLTQSLKQVDVRTGCQVQTIESSSEKSNVETCDRWTASYRVQWEESSGTSEEEFDALILATPVSTTAQLLQTFEPGVSRAAAEISSASMAILALGFDHGQLPGLPECFGFVVPELEQRAVMACSVSSQKFPNRAPTGKVLLRCFIGGQMHADRVGWDDTTLLEAALRDLGDWVGLRGRPELVEVIRWPNAMPQYELGHAERVANVRSALMRHAGLTVCGSSWSGVGIPACIASARAAVAEIMNPLQENRCPKI